MPRILLFLSVVLIIVAGVFSFLTKPKITEYQATIIATKADLKASNTTLTKSREDLLAANTQAAADKKRADDAVAEKNTINGQLQTAQQQAKAAEDKVTAAAAEIEKLTKTIADKGNDPAVESPALVEARAKLKEAETKLSELETVNKTLTQKSTETENKLDNFVKAEAKRVGVQMAKGLTGQVLAVNRSYNFIVISLGDKQGVVMNGEMLIKRGGSQVGKVKITSVEPTTSIADIVPGSMGRGVSVQAGDEVIYPGVGI